MKTFLEVAAWHLFGFITNPMLDAILAAGLAYHFFAR